MKYFIQRNTISNKGQTEAETLSAETKKMLGKLNQQVALDFSGSSTKYFNNIFENIRKHVNSICDDIEDLYKENQNYGCIDSRVGNVKSGFIKKSCRLFYFATIISLEFQNTSKFSS